MYSIVFERQTRILHLTLAGLWTKGTLARFTAELLVRTSTTRLRHGRFAVLSDSARFAVWPRDVAEEFTRLMAQGANAHRRPTAIVVASVLNKLQAERTMASPRLAVFLSLAEARAWLETQEY